MEDYRFPTKRNIVQEGALKNQADQALCLACFKSEYCRGSVKQFGNIPENWLLNSIMRQKLNFSLEREIYEGIIEGRAGKDRPKRRWSQYITGRMHTDVTEAGHCAQDRDA